MPPRKQKKNMKKLADVLKECRISTLPKENSPAKPEKPSGKLVDNNQNETIDDLKVDFKVPPIFLHEPVNFKDHVHTLLLTGIKFYQPHTGGKYTKVKCLSFEDHGGMVQYLKSKKLPYHTYGNPDHRKMKVVVCGLPKDTCLKTLKDEIENLTIPVVRLHKMHTKQTGKEHPLLVLVVVASADVDKLMQVEILLGKTVKMERPVVKTRQCHRCQKWGHSQRYCHGQVRCVKCAGKHFSSKCTRNRDLEPPKCANHTANYKKCSHCPDSENYKETLKLKGSLGKKIKPRLVTLSNYKDSLYCNMGVLPTLGDLTTNFECYDDELREMCEQMNKASDSYIYKYATLTSVDVERSFSMYKWILTVSRNRLTMSNVERIVLIYYNSKQSQSL